MNEIKKIEEKVDNALKESKYIDFKEKFDPNSKQDCCEIIKDIIALANSGGGIIIIGIKNNGDFSDFDLTPLLGYDNAKLTDKIAKYTSVQFSAFEIKEMQRKGRKVVVIIVYESEIPMIFTSPGTYNVGNGKQNNAFAQGTVYFRHGSKSEPGNQDDIRKVIEREVEKQRKSWLGNIKKIVTAPNGSRVEIVHNYEEPPIGIDTSKVRIVDDKDALPVSIIDPDSTYPHRQKEVINIFNKRMFGAIKINQFDVLSVRKMHKIDETTPKYCFKIKYVSLRYSDAFIEWLIEEYNKDHDFFIKARQDQSKSK